MQVRQLRPTSWLARRLGLSTSTIERLRAQGGNALPPYVRIGRHSIRYDEDVVEAWIETRVVSDAVREDKPALPSGLRRIGKKLVRYA